MCRPYLWLEIYLALGPLIALHHVTAAALVLESPSSLAPISQRVDADNETTVLPVEAPIDAALSAKIFTTTTSLNATLPITLVANRPEYSCNGTLFGRNLNYRSCMDALSSMEEYQSPQTFGQRGLGKWDINLPLRFLSSKS